MFPLGGFEAHLQGAVAYQTSRPSLLNVTENEIYGDIPSSTFLDLAFGVTNDKYSVELFLANATDEDAAIYVSSHASRRPVACSRTASHRGRDDRHPLPAGFLTRDASLNGRGATGRPSSFHTFESGNDALRRFM